MQKKRDQQQDREGANWFYPQVSPSYEPDNPGKYLNYHGDYSD